MNDYDTVACAHCGGKGYHGDGAIFDEDTGRWHPTDCGCCAGRGYHRFAPNDGWTAADVRRACYSPGV